jgi:hypothetical protein
MFFKTVSRKHWLDGVFVALLVIVLVVIALTLYSLSDWNTEDVDVLDSSAASGLMWGNEAISPDGKWLVTLVEPERPTFAFLPTIRSAESHEFTTVLISDRDPNLYDEVAWIDKRTVAVRLRDGTTLAWHWRNRDLDMPLMLTGLFVLITVVVAALRSQSQKSSLSD